MSFLKMSLLSIIPGLIGAIATAITEYIMKGDITVLYATGAGIFASVIALLTIIYLQKKKGTNIDEGDVTIQSGQNNVITQSEKKDTFTDSPIFGFGVLITILISLLALKHFWGYKLYADYSKLDSINDQVVTVRASGYTEWEYIYRTAISGCIRVGDMLVPISMGFKEYPGQSGMDKMANPKYIYSFKCATVEEAERINNAIDN